jgi:hypothetical protein
VTVTCRTAAPFETDVGVIVTLKFLELSPSPFRARLDGVTALGLVAVLTPSLHAAAATANPRPTATARRERHVTRSLLFVIEKLPLSPYFETHLISVHDDIIDSTPINRGGVSPVCTVVVQAKSQSRLAPKAPKTQ